MQPKNRERRKGEGLTPKLSPKRVNALNRGNCPRAWLKKFSYGGRYWVFRIRISNSKNQK